MAGAEVLSLLRDKGLKVTPQRLAIYDLLVNTTAHPSAEAIYEKVRQQYPSISFNTVYKTLEALGQRGLIRRLSAAENVYRYDADTRPHGHLVCLKCGRIDDLHWPVGAPIDALRREAMDRTDYRILGEDVYLYGYCPECRSKAP